MAGGIVYLVLFIYGLVVPKESDATFVPLNNADNVLHIVLAIAMIGLGLCLALTRRSNSTSDTPRQ